MKHTHEATRRTLLSLLAALCLCAGATAQEKKEKTKEFKPTREQTSEAARLRTAGGENKEALEASVKDYPPVINVLPFDFDPAQDFNEWLAGFLPPRAIMRPTKRGR